jgi:type IV pilus assembly protein PilF
MRQTLINTLVLFIAVAVAVTVGCGNKKLSVSLAKQKDAKSSYDLSMAFFMSDKGPQAIEEMLEASELDPYSAKIQNGLGLLYFYKERFEKSEAAYKKAIELDPEFSDAHHNLGTLYLYLGRYPEAVSQFSEALTNDTYRSQSNSLNSLGWALLKMQDYVAAEKHFKDVIERDRKYLIAYGNLAKVYMATNRIDDAVVQLEYVFLQAPFYPEANLDMGICMLKKNNQVKAREHFLKVLQIDPTGKLGAQAQEYLNLLE